MYRLEPCSLHTCLDAALEPRMGSAPRAYTRIPRPKCLNNMVSFKITGQPGPKRPPGSTSHKIKHVTLTVFKRTLN